MTKETIILDKSNIFPTDVPRLAESRKWAGIAAEDIGLDNVVLVRVGDGKLYPINDGNHRFGRLLEKREGEAVEVEVRNATMPEAREIKLYEKYCAERRVTDYQDYIAEMERLANSK